jgi:hypothetical protein
MGQLLLPGVNGGMLNVTTGNTIKRRGCIDSNGYFWRIHAGGKTVIANQDTFQSNITLEGIVVRKLHSPQFLSEGRIGP